MAQQIIVTKDNYGIGLSCNFIDKNKNPIDLTDKVVEVVIVDANNETIDIKQAVIVDYTNAKASIVLEKIHTSTLGLYKTFWSVLDDNQNITAQEDVYYYVKDKNNGSEGNVDSGFDVEDVFKNLEDRLEESEDRLEESEDSLKELKERTNYLNEQLDNMKNKFKPNKKGFNFWLGDPGYIIPPSNYDTFITKAINNLKIVGATDVIIPLIYSKDGSTISQITTDELLLKCINGCIENGINVVGIKPHLTLSDDTDLMENYKNELIRVADLVKNKCKYFSISNENELTTSKYDSFFIELINILKLKGFKVFATFTISEFKRCKFIDYLDCIGLNIYPCLTTIGWTEKLSNMVDKMFIDCNGSHYLKYFDKIKQTFNNKELWITEIGCFDSNENLLKPFDWNAHGELQNGNAQSKFYNAVLESLCLVDFIDGLFFWESGSTGYSPFHSARNGKCIEILKKYWSDKNE